jgi:hypothetical protein
MNFTTPLTQAALTVFGTLLLAYFFAKAEIHIEGDAGWAINLPTWRVEEHWLLDVFWGGRPMTGYHAWVFPFISLLFHFPIFFTGQWSGTIEARAIGCIILFWMAEDFLWFLMNPAYGLRRYKPEHIHWHKRWIWFAPTEYWLFTPVASTLMWYSYHS